MSPREQFMITEQTEEGKAADVGPDDKAEENKKRQSKSFAMFKAFLLFNPLIIMVTATILVLLVAIILAVNGTKPWTTMIIIMFISGLWVIFGALVRGGPGNEITK